uniref:Sialin n=2 Tax=Nyssomyia neivai TaxID=330878 RepID=A0A1L8DE91_9DIPT
MKDNQTGEMLRSNTQLVTSQSTDTVNRDNGGISWKFWRSRRYIVVLMAFFGFFNVYGLRVNLSVAIVAMTEKFNVTLENGTVIEDQHFDWNSKQQGLILSSFFYGYIWTQLLGGWLGSKIGGHYVFGAGIGMTAFLTLLTPIAANTNIYVMVAIRVIEGIFEGVTYPCIHAIWARWAPVYERSRMSSIAYAGSYAGTVVAMPLSGVLAQYWGWESVFYVSGAIGCIWCLAWLLIVKASPAQDPYISEEEKQYIQSSIGDLSKQKINHPWKAIVTSTGVWAIVAANFAETWGAYTYLTQLPTFLRDTLNFDLGSTGFLAAMPYLMMICLMAFSGYAADRLQETKVMTTRQVRRTFICFGFVIQIAFLMLTSHLENPKIAVACIVLAVGLSAFTMSGFLANPLDLAPNHASVILGFSNTMGTIPGIVSPMLTGYIVTDKTKEQWRLVFYITSAVFAVGCILYWVLAKGELQPWAQQTNLQHVESQPTKEDEAETKSSTADVKRD